MAEQIPFGTDNFVDNPEPRCPCVLVLDTSGSMQGEPIRQLNEGLQFYRDEVSADSLASKRVEVAIVTFGPVKVDCDFTTAGNFVPPVLEASGYTPLGAAILKAIEMVQERKSVYKANGIQFFRPWIFCITDGGPDPGDPWQEAAAAIREGEKNKHFSFWSIGVEDANFEVLSQLGSRGEPLKLKGLRFRDFFAWLSNSQQSVSRSAPGAAVPLSNPTGPKGWADVEV